MRVKALISHYPGISKRLKLEKLPVPFPLWNCVPVECRTISADVWTLTDIALNQRVQQLYGFGLEESRSREVLGTKFGWGEKFEISPTSPSLEGLGRGAWRGPLRKVSNKET